MLGKRIILIDDEPDICEIVKFNLVKDGFEVQTFGNPINGLVAIFSNPPDLVITDWLMPDMEGLEVCRNIRNDAKTRNLPVIMISCKNAESDLVSALEVGADDYLSKPFRMQELLARVRKRLIKPEISTNQVNHQASSNSIKKGINGSAQIRIKDLIIDRENFEVKLNNEKLELTFSEFKLLELLASYPGKVFPRSQLIESGFGIDYFVSERSVDVRIVNLRRKLGKHKDLIETVRSVGYRFNVDLNCS
jgi:DNA-binding response OmpR family regulator